MYSGNVRWSPGADQTNAPWPNFKNYNLQYIAFNYALEAWSTWVLVSSVPAELGMAKYNPTKLECDSFFSNFFYFNGLILQRMIGFMLTQNRIEFEINKQSKIIKLCDSCDNF
jgi:hypothetical protein